jgi:hypothetical protein
VRDPFKREREGIERSKKQLEALDKIVEQNQTGVAVVPVNPPSAK